MGYDLYSLVVPAPSLEEREHLLHAAMSASEVAGDPLRAIQAGFDALEATGSYFRFNFIAWPKLVQLALRYGWEPAHEARYYLANDGQVVSAEDARCLADALERALGALPGVASEVVTPSSLWDLDPEVFWANRPGKISRFIEFARRGAFEIT